MNPRYPKKQQAGCPEWIMQRIRAIREQTIAGTRIPEAGQKEKNAPETKFERFIKNQPESA